jgi:hypothetical protein
MVLLYTDSVHKDSYLYLRFKRLIEADCGLGCLNRKKAQHGFTNALFCKTTVGG